MKNQISTSSQNILQNEHGSINQNTQILKKPKINYWMVSNILLFFVIAAGGSLFILNIRSKISSQQRPLKIQANQTVVMGVVRLSGLSNEEKQQLGLTTVNYQVTDFGKVYQAGQVAGYFLLTNSVNDELLGKCVRVTGSIPEEWKNKNKDKVYNRLVLNVANIEKIDSSNCNPHSQSQLPINNTQEKLTL